MPNLVLEHHSHDRSISINGRKIDMRDVNTLAMETAFLLYGGESLDEAQLGSKLLLFMQREFGDEKASTALAQAKETYKLITG